MRALVCLLSSLLILGCASTGNVSTQAGATEFYVEEIAKAGNIPAFVLLKKVRCDEFDRTVFFHNPPRWTVGWARPEWVVPRTIPERCTKVFKDKHAAGELDVPGADAVLVDGQSGEFLDDFRYGADGWAIRFEDPSPEAVRARLAKRVRSPVDLLQLTTTLAWVERNQVRDFLGDMQIALPLDLATEPIRGWGPPEVAILKTLARLDASQTTLWLAILRAGTHGGGDPDFVSAFAKGGHAMIAGRMAGCSGKSDLVPELEQIMRKATVLPHKIAAGKALVSLGSAQLVKDYAIRLRTSLSQRQLLGIAEGRLAYDCKGLV